MSHKFLLNLTKHFVKTFTKKYITICQGKSKRKNPKHLGIGESRGDIHPVSCHKPKYLLLKQFSLNVKVIQDSFGPENLHHFLANQLGCPRFPYCPYHHRHIHENATFLPRTNDFFSSPSISSSYFSKSPRCLTLKIMMARKWRLTISLHYSLIYMQISSHWCNC